MQPRRCNSCARRGADDPEVGAILAEMSNIMPWADDFDGAERAAREAARVFRAVPHHPDRVMADYFLGDILFYRGRIDEAAVLFERALAAHGESTDPSRVLPRIHSPRWRKSDSHRGTSWTPRR